MGGGLGIKNSSAGFCFFVSEGWGWEMGCGVVAGGVVVVVVVRGDVLLIQQTHSGTPLAALLLLIQHRRTLPTVLKSTQHTTMRI